jgi:hypothetical protein
VRGIETELPPECISRRTASDAKNSRKREKVFHNVCTYRSFRFHKKSFVPIGYCATAGLKEGKKLSGEASSPGFRP